MTALANRSLAFAERVIFVANDESFCDFKSLRLGHDLPRSVNNSDFAFLGGFYFHETWHMQSFGKIKPSQKFSEFTVFYAVFLLDTSS